ncbi:MAG: imidazoleglycerol-phosphate dehydratase HisB [Planctomycetota bacterium]
MARTRRRTAEIRRHTRETRIRLRLDLDGTGRFRGRTPIGFFDHMLDSLARHALLDLEMRAEGDSRVDGHHTVEDVGIVLGKALDEALGDRKGIRRFGSAIVPLDEALALAAVDLSGRGHLEYRVPPTRTKAGAYDPNLTEDFLEALAKNGRLTLHVQALWGRNVHHIQEAVFKAVARALREALEMDPRVRGIPSTKGSL